MGLLCVYFLLGRFALCVCFWLGGFAGGGDDGGFIYLFIFSVVCGGGWMWWLWGGCSCGCGGVFFYFFVAVVVWVVGFVVIFGSVVASGAKNSWVEKERDKEREEE